MIGLTYTPNPNEPDLGNMDALLYLPSIANKNALESALLISLFTDARAADDDPLPDPESDIRRGWWGDGYPDTDNDQIGSKLWLLSREKQTETTRARAEGYARDALQWLIDDGVVKTLDVTALWLDTGILGIAVVLTKPDYTVENYQFAYAWEQIVNSESFAA